MSQCNETSKNLDDTSISPHILADESKIVEGSIDETSHTSDEVSNIVVETSDETQHADESKIINNKCIFSVDYDGCFSAVTCNRIKRIIKTCFPDKEGYMEEISRPLHNLIEMLDSKYDEIDLVCGSARQDYFSNQSNRTTQSEQYRGYSTLTMKADEGCVFTDLENFTKSIQESESTKSKWNLWKLLYADKDDEIGISCGNPMRKIFGFDMTKRDLIKYQILKSVEENGPNFDYVFIDDRKDILTHLKNMIESKPEWLPPTVNVYLYRYDFFDIATKNCPEAFKLFFQN